MPEIRHYTVTQTRKVKVMANNPKDAAIVADLAFSIGTDANGSVRANMSRDIFGDTRSKVLETGLDVQDERA